MRSCNIISLILFAYPTFGTPSFPLELSTDLELPGITPTSTGPDPTANVTTSSKCTATYAPRHVDKCGDVASHFGIHLKDHEAGSSLNTTTCQDKLLSHGICLLDLKGFTRYSPGSVSEIQTATESEPTMMASLDSNLLEGSSGPVATVTTPSTRTDVHTQTLTFEYALSDAMDTQERVMTTTVTDVITDLVVTTVAAFAQATSIPSYNTTRSRPSNSSIPSTTARSTNCSSSSSLLRTSKPAILTSFTSSSSSLTRTSKPALQSSSISTSLSTSSLAPVGCTCSMPIPKSSKPALQSSSSTTPAIPYTTSSGTMLKTSKPALQSLSSTVPVVPSYSSSQSMSETSKPALQSLSSVTSATTSCSDTPSRTSKPALQSLSSVTSATTSCSGTPSRTSKPALQSLSSTAPAISSPYSTSQSSPGTSKPALQTISSTATAVPSYSSSQSMSETSKPALQSISSTVSTSTSCSDTLSRTSKPALQSLSSVTSATSSCSDEVSRTSKPALQSLSSTVPTASTYVHTTSKTSKPALQSTSSFVTSGAMSRTSKPALQSTTSATSVVSSYQPTTAPGPKSKTSKPALQSLTSSAPVPPAYNSTNASRSKSRTSKPALQSISSVTSAIPSYSSTSKSGNTSKTSKPALQSLSSATSAIPSSYDMAARIPRRSGDAALRSVSATSRAACGQNVYRMHSGNGSVIDGWPSMSEWVDFDCMFATNTGQMRISCAQWGVENTSAAELAHIKQAIIQIATSSGIDQRFILAVILQESMGCVRAITTEYSHPNPGLMQSYNGIDFMASNSTGTCNSNTQASNLWDTNASLANVDTPCSYGEIHQMIQDGTEGTAYGDGLAQCMQKQGNTDDSRWYRTARMYNGGSIQDPNNLNNGCCTASYANDVANRLTGWTTAPRNFVG